MYASYWGLSRSPFPASADSGGFYDGAMHHEALSRLMFLVEDHGRCGVLTGPSGTGKTQLLRLAARQVRRTQRFMTAVDLRGLSQNQLLWSLAAALQLGPRDGELAQRLWRMLEDYLRGSRHSGLPRVFVFDHLDRAAADCAHVIEWLLHLDDGPSCRTTVLIAGRAFDGPATSHLQAISALRIEIAALGQEETAEYVRALFSSAGGDADVFTDEALDLVFAKTRGVPRDINRLCDLSLLAAMGANCPNVDSEAVNVAGRELPAAVERDDTLSLLFESA
ncbi:MAG: AAA family ATPase [Planctomycetaceae bacterium]